MSRVYFHTKAGAPFELRGSERAYAGVLVDDVAFGVLSTLGGSEDYGWGRKVIPEGHYLHSAAPRDFQSRMRTALRGPMADITIAVASDRRVAAWTLNLNTVMALRSDALTLAARLHAQCEIHCFVRGHNRAWLAGIVERGVASRVLREPWQPLAAWLRAGDADVVCSYSVCEWFPHSSDDGEQPGDWDTQFAALHPTLELSPGEWLDYRFHEGDTWWDVAAYAAGLPSDAGDPA